MDLRIFIILEIILCLYLTSEVESRRNRNRTRTVFKPQVQTPSGILQGKFGNSRAKREFYKFLGIPYALPPIDERRFEPPLPTGPWNGISYVEKHHPPCLQLNLISVRLTGTEDCLYANVFVPKTDNGPNRSKNKDDDDEKRGNQNEDQEDNEDEDDPRNDNRRVSRSRTHRRHDRRNDREMEVGFNILEIGSKRSLPVMVYIYGGYFMYGSARLYGPQYFMDEDVILVTFNYRVGALGFLNTGDSVVRGNMGLKDQNLLLKWVQQNIQYFGGDPNQVTLFGESAGASSVHLHILSKMSTGLFQKAIAQSGSAIRTWTISNQPAEQTKRLATQLNCTTINSHELIRCLKKVDPIQIASAHSERLNILSNPLAQFGPSMETVLDDKTFIYNHPLVTLLSGNFSHIPLMIGVTQDEGLIYSARIIENAVVMNRINRDWANTAPVLLNYNGNLENAAEKISNFYLKQNSFRNSKSKFLDFGQNFKEFTNMFSDRLYIAATRISALEHSKYAPVYAYIYSYQGEFSFYNVFRSSASAGNAEGSRIQELGYSLLSSWVSRNIFGQNQPKVGVCHLDDVVMLFKLRVLSNVRRWEVDYPMSKAMIKSWVQFASENGNLRFNDQTWLPINRQDESPLYMNLNIGNGGGMIPEPFTNRAKFWESIGIIV